MSKNKTSGNNYWNANALCPFYRRVGNKRIVCEWYGKSEITQVFKDEKEMRVWLYEYCVSNDYKKCALCVANEEFYNKGTG